MSAMEPKNAPYTFDDYLRERLTDEKHRIQWGGEEAVARAAICLYKARDERGISQKELAERAGTKQPNISAIENGEGNPTVRTLGRLAAALRVDVADLLGGVDRYGVYRKTGFENLHRRLTMARRRLRLERSSFHMMSAEDRSGSIFFSPKMQKGPDSDEASDQERVVHDLVA